MAGGDGGAQAANRHRVGLVVIHGVGETDPGYAVNTLMETLGKVTAEEDIEDYDVSNMSGYQRLHEDPSKEDSPVFPVVSRRASRKDGTELTAIELHWADLTNLQPGRFSALAGLFRVIFESHHLVDAMLRRGGEIVANVLRALLWLASWTMRGPIAALTIATSAVCLFLLFGPVPYDPLSKSWLNVALGDERSRFVFIQLVLYCSALISLALIAERRDISWYDTVFWLLLVTAAILVLDQCGKLTEVLKKVPPLTVRQSGTPPPECFQTYDQAACYIEGLYRVIIWGWRFYGLILLIAVAALVTRAVVMGRDRSLGPIATSIGIVILQFMMWTTIIVSALYTMLNRAELNKELAPLRTDILGLFEEQGGQLSDSAAKKLFQFPNIPFDWIDRFKFVYLVTVFTIFICIVLTIMLVRKRRRIANVEHAALADAEKRMSRVLFNPALTGTLITLFLVLISLIYLQPELEKYERFRDLRKMLLPVAAIFAIGAPFLIGHRISNIVHIARDLIDHHYVPRIETASYFFPWHFRQRFTRPRRSVIERRLLTMLEQRVMPEKFDVVIFVAHSQGSVVAFDYMRDHMAGQGALGGARAQFMSFGSPLGHIYQKYFYEYVPDGPAWMDVAERVEYWINLWRVDDPIGGRIELPEGADIENVVMGAGGHMNYWNEPALARALHDLIEKSRVRPTRMGAPPPPRRMPPLFPPLGSSSNPGVQGPEPYAMPEA